MPSRHEATHQFEPHTGEVRLEVTASSCEGLFAEAGRALAELMMGEVPPTAPSTPEVCIEARARDRAALLVEWLNELIYLSETRKQVFTHLDVEAVDDRQVRATVAGVTPAVLKTAVKAATLHGLSLVRRSGRWRATVVLDV